jgi:hypothetical protein
VRRGSVWCGVAQYGAAWLSMVRRGSAWCGVAQMITLAPDDNISSQMITFRAR